MGETTIPNGIAAVILVAVLAGLTIVAVRIDRQGALPSVLHNAVWAVTLLLVGSNLIAYREASPVAWGILLVGLVFFNLGSWWGTAWGARRIARLPLPPADKSIAIVGRTTLGILLAAYAVGFATYLLVIAGRFGLATLFTDPVSIRSATDSYLASVPLWARLLLYVGPFLVAVAVVPRSIRGGLSVWWRAAIVVAVGASMLLLLQRTNLFTAVLWAIAALYLATRRSAAPDPHARRRARRPLAIAGAVAGLAVVAVLAFQLLGAALGKTGDWQAARETVSPALAQSGLMSPFVYLTAGTPAFLALTSSDNVAWPRADGARVIYGDYNPQTWGAALFEGPLSIIPGARPWNPVAPFVDVGTLTNVYTWFEPFYRDFRELGVAAGALAMGLLIGYMYRTRALSPARFWLSALLVSTIFLAPFVQKLHTTLYLASAGVVILCAVARRRRSVDG
ncbi:O-antigen polymerase [Microbacterium sp. Root180]|uniref:O-antigen polymerase n=1 Tax=Microbacterium sp. Root180 TaxID=1736483 RepID=UPI0006FD2F54|nr:O-antigen polymerase [Microbacterium sp. Root180]KRB36251.1 hypothetical protein ASD93_09135 [Microbacterium sp. Root180]